MLHVASCVLHAVAHAVCVASSAAVPQCNAPQRSAVQSTVFSSVHSSVSEVVPCFSLAQSKLVNCLGEPGLRRLRNPVQPDRITLPCHAHSAAESR